MKNKGVLIATIVFSLLLNTTQLWEGKMGMFAMIIFLILIIYFFVLVILLIGQLFKAFKEKFKESQRIFLMVLMIFVLVTSFMFPHGLISYGIFESNSLLIAQREGVANCMTTLKLKANNKFIERSVCFGVTETTGEYRISGDTIYFENISLGRHEKEFYEFAVLVVEDREKGKYLGDLVRFENDSDTIGSALWIIKNEFR